MANPPPRTLKRGTGLLLQDKFDGGFKRDFGRDQLPKNALWAAQDVLPEIGGAPLRKRGGWSKFGNSLNSVYASTGLPKIVFFAPFSDTADPRGGITPQVLVWEGTNGHLLDMTNNADRGATSIPLHTPTFFRDLVIWGDGSNTPKKYNGSAVSSLGGSPPTTPRCSCVFKERVIFSGRMTTPAEAATIYFSAAGNAESWDTTNAMVRTNGTVQGLASIRNSVLVFHGGSVEKFRADRFPSSTNVEGFYLDPLFDSVGIFDPSSFAVQDDFVVWADERGIYKTDGASLVDLTARGGIRTYWQALSKDTVAVGIWRNYAFVSVMSASEYTDFLVCDLAGPTWWRFSNVTALNFSPTYVDDDALYYSNRYTHSGTTYYIGNLASALSPAAGNKNDGNDTAVLPFIETGFFHLGGHGRKRIRHLYVAYDLRDAASDNPTLTPSYGTTPETTGITTSALSETTDYSRKRVRVGKATAGISVALTQANASSETKIYSLEVEEAPREGSRRT